MSILRHMINSRPQLLSSVFVGVVLSVLVLPDDWALLTRVLVGWNVGVLLFLVLMGSKMLRADANHVQQLAYREDRSHGFVLVCMCLTAVASIVTIVLDLANAKGLPHDVRLLHYGLTALTIVLSWCFIAALFTLIYARLYYRSPVDARALVFADRELTPNYWDFLYFSFTIAVAAQTADVAVASRMVRKTVLAQSINIAAGVVGG